MSLLLLGLVLSLASAQSSVVNSCSGRGSCQRHLRPLAPSDSTGDTSEDRVLGRLLCHLECLDSVRDQENGLSMCQNNCSTFMYNPDVIQPTDPPPVSEPDLMERNQDGLYVITIPGMMSTGSDAVLIGSGETGSGGGLMTGSESPHLEVYVVRVSWHGNHTYFPLTSRQGELDLSQFSCSQINVSYAVLSSSSLGLSDYSPPATTCVFIPLVDAPAAENLTVVFEEIAGRRDFLQQARIFVSWDAPYDATRVQAYELTVSLTSTDEDSCTQKAPFVYDLDQGQANITIEPTGDKSTSVLLMCTYDFELNSLPGNKSVSLNVLVEYSRSDRRSFEKPPKCDGRYVPGSVSYNLSISWTIKDPLVLEAVDEYSVSLTPLHSSLNLNFLAQSTRESFEEGQTDFVFYFNLPVETEKLLVLMTVQPIRPSRNDDYFWRKVIVPGKGECDVTTVAHPPVQISRANVSVQMYLVSSSVLNFILTWAPPTFLNGDLERYEICIGEDGVTGSATCVQPSDCLYLHASESDSAKNLVGCTQLGVVDSPQEPTTDIGYHVVAKTELLFLQIRGVNSFNLLGEWSDPLLIYNSSSDASGAQGSGSEATGNREWIYVVVSMLCLVVLALGALLVLWVYRHFCFHRRIKYENTMTMERIHGNYYPPTFIPVADDWEVPSEDVEIFYSEELGHGAFGRVYRGLLHCRELRDLVTGGRRSTRKRGSFGQRRLSRRKTSQSMGSRLVAIKRLRDNIDGADKANFLKEIEMIKKVSGANHDHQKFVVNMLGCVTVQEPMMLVLEYVTHGDLLTYLRNSREGDEGATNPKAAPYLEPKGAYSKLPPRAPGQEGEGEEEEDHKLTETDLLSFARQIAAGMEFLASLSVVHRDLACRNILVCENSLVKISDFGLSRTLVNQEAYVTTTKGVLPIRWMAPEALFYRTFDTQSDVWSYGILLWELYTLGGYPYPTMSNRDIIDLLSRGYRMDKPELCTNQVYSVMLQCWSSLGVERPDFRELYLVFDNMLSESTHQQSPYIQVLGTCYYDKLGPRVQVDSDTLDLENIPANVDMRQLTTNSAAPTAEAAFGTSLPENGNGFLSVSAVAQPQSQDHSGASAPVNQGLGVPLDLSRPRSWVGTSTAELGPRYVPAPLYCASPHSSVSNLTQETTFGSTAATVSPEHGHRLLSTLQSRSVGSLPLLTNPPALHQTTRL